MNNVPPTQTEDEQACKARIAFADKEPHHELNSWLGFGDGNDVPTITIGL